MTSSSRIQWRKEVRDLAPWWLGTVITMAACWLLMHPEIIPFDLTHDFNLLQDRSFLLSVGLCAYVAGAVTLGALSIGQEFSHHTLTQLVTLPVARSQILQMKLTVLGAMLAGLGLLAWWAWASEPGWIHAADGSGRRLAIGAVPVGCGLLLAPWMAMMTRGPLGGAVFTLMVPGLLWFSVLYFRVPEPIIWTVAGAIGVAGAAVTWRMFLYLEVAGDHHQEIDLLGWLRRPSTSDVQAGVMRRPGWALLRKELRLQQMTLVTAGVCFLAWTIAFVGRGVAPDVFPASALFVTAALPSGLVPLLAGALASAEERRLRTADWQNLLPVPAWRQWSIKAGVAVGLTLILGIVLPKLLDLVSRESGFQQPQTAMATVVICTAALYVSTLSQTGVRAFLTTLPAIGVAMLAFLWVLWPLIALGRFAEPAVVALARFLKPVVQVSHMSFFWWTFYGKDLVAGGLAILLVCLASSNHRIADRRAGRVGRQVGWIAAYLVAAYVLFMLIAAMFYVFSSSRMRL